MISIVDADKQLSDHQVSELEARLGVKLPEEFRTFLLRSNGGRPEPDRFAIAWRPGQHAAAVGSWSMVSWFYGIHNSRHCDLWHENAVTFAGRLPVGTIAVACDPGGDQLLIRTHGPRVGEVLFWSMEFEAATEDGELVSEANVGHIAFSFDAFLTSLAEVQ